MIDSKEARKMLLNQKEQDAHGVSLRPIAYA